MQAMISSLMVNRFGRVTWETNPRGVITFMSHVGVTGALLQRIEDVNTELMSGVPAGWVHGMNMIISAARCRTGWVTIPEGAEK